MPERERRDMFIYVLFLFIYVRGYIGEQEKGFLVGVLLIPAYFGGQGRHPDEALRSPSGLRFRV